MSVKVNSRNTLTDVIEFVNAATRSKIGHTHLDLRQRVISQGADDKHLTVTAVHSWPGMALSHLDDPTAWWVIADMSDVVDPFLELQVGRALKCPSQHRYFFGVLGDEA